MSLDASRLVGAWSLQEFRVSFDDGREPVFPYGEDARGMLVYSASGHVSAVLSAANRAPLSVPDLESAPRAPMDEKAAAFDTYMSYAGTYRIDGDHAVHAVEMALTPNIVGREQARLARLDGDELVLSYDVESARGTRHLLLRWKRL